MKPGVETPIRPIPPIDANTERFAAGAVSFGVEFRLLNAAITGEHMAQHSAEEIAANKAGGGGDLDTSGVSIHVFGADGHEYLRFDCFDDGPHYHYIDPASPTQTIVGMDLAANGDALDWSLACLRTRLSPMLEAAGGGSVARAAQSSQVLAALDQVEAAARRITAQA
jgi:hypothetical protein